MKWRTLPLRSSRNRPLLWAIVLVLSVLSHSACGQAVKILPLGDSWTSGHNGYVSYRYDLWFDLVDAGFDVDFVGYLTDTYHPPKLDLYPRYLTDFDRDHAGFWGYTTGQLISEARSVARSRQPDIVLLWAGGNDIAYQGSNATSSVRSGLHEIIEAIREGVPGATILLGKLAPFESRNSASIVSVNEVIAEVAFDLDTAESPVILVDLYSGFDIESMTQSDKIHHNRTGEAWIAANWFEALAGILTDTEPFRINVGHSGAWWNPETSGQGLLLDVEPEEQYMFLAWFTYTDGEATYPAEQHWFTAQGNYSGDSATLPVYQTLGGRFDDPRPVSGKVVGEMNLRFDNCNQGTVSYAIDDWEVQGAFPIQRLIPDSENICEQKLGPAVQTVDINPGMDGAWYDTDTAGQGFLFDVHADASGGNYIFAAWFTYGDATASGHRWLTAQGGFEGSAASIDVSETTGGLFDDSQPVSTGPIGTMTVDFIDCSSATLSYVLPNEAREGIMDLTRLLPKGRSLCEEIAVAR